ncbi:NAD-dependent isocitrate dehydrogenase [Stylosanthes scabra]|uniref:NAD-dependent isocitrate dehydrogenase n=1 Tax=Stylosanthes scabra TaxID=79078 RepID=A0ABU6QAC7_9FABA|nr:NAD-dependent isocitrate dehydrogenase [Stylosanthes scabra]
MAWAAQSSSTILKPFLATRINQSRSVTYMPRPSVIESLKVVTKLCSKLVAKYAFEYACLNIRKTVTVVHKANIMKLAGGLFLESCQEFATKYPIIKYKKIIVDNCWLSPNLYGNLIANTTEGIAVVLVSCQEVRLLFTEV